MPAFCRTIRHCGDEGLDDRRAIQRTGISDARCTCSSVIHAQRVRSSLMLGALALYSTTLSRPAACTRPPLRRLPPRVPERHPHVSSPTPAHPSSILPFSPPVLPRLPHPAAPYLIFAPPSLIGTDFAFPSRRYTADTSGRSPVGASRGVGIQQRGYPGGRTCRDGAIRRGRAGGGSPVAHRWAIRFPSLQSRPARMEARTRLSLVLQNMINISQR
ncbi:hypothetical protein B0H10DRAFT_449200 [Mycena sp. CBHHK59/15]|nr:hypothetical protein B0H10DRAFT_449200 [Mycena sp. CBHHK59/15]